MEALQDRYGTATICFGCGPSNSDGLQIKSYVEGDVVVTRFVPDDHHQAFPGVVNGGIIGVLFDCHSNWTAAYHLANSLGLDHPPVTVTADYHVNLRRPTPYPFELTVIAWPVEIRDRQAVIDAELIADERVTATCRGTFVAVEEGHPAFHRW